MSIKKDSMTTLEIEIALMEECNVRQNIVVPNVCFGIVRYFMHEGKRVYDELHECDILKVTKAGYATEYEIKISKADFLKDLKKKHNHGSKFIKQLYYVVPFHLVLFAKENLPENAGLMYVENGEVKSLKDAPIKESFKWTQEEMNKLSRLGTMRILTLKKQLNKAIKKAP